MARATDLVVNPGGPGTTLRLVGDVGPVLRSECVWRPGVATQTGDIVTVDPAAESLPFGLGAAAFGQPPEDAVQRLGEYVLIAAESWWAPAGATGGSVLEDPGEPMLTPFVIRWDLLESARATLTSAEPIRLVHWYDHVMRELVARGACTTGVLAVELTTTGRAGRIVDKQLSRPPLQSNRPDDRGLITDARHLDAYFRRNAVAHAYGVDTECTVIMVGVVVDPTIANSAWEPEIIRRSFYTTPGLTSSAKAIHHTHALAQAAGAPNVVTHIENDTLITSAELRIGAVAAIESTS